VSPRWVQSKARSAAAVGGALAGWVQSKGWWRPRRAGRLSTASFLIGALRDIGRIAAKSRSPLGVGIAARRRPPAVAGAVPNVGKRSNGRGTADQLRVGWLPFAASRDPPSRGGA